MNGNFPEQHQTTPKRENYPDSFAEKRVSSDRYQRKSNS